MPFGNLKIVLKIGDTFASKLNLALLLAVGSRPWMQRPIMAWLRRFRDADGVVWTRVRSVVTRTTQCIGIRMDHRSSDMQTFYEMVMHDSYKLRELPPPDLIIDGGGNVGFFTLAAKTLWPKAQAIVFEPVPGNQRLLQAHLDRNHVQAELVPACLGASVGTQSFYMREANRGSFDAREPYTSVVEVPVVKLSDYLQAAAGKHVLIKLDVEGAEVDIMEELLSAPRKHLTVCGELHWWKENEARLRGIIDRTGWHLSLQPVDEVCAYFLAASPESSRHEAVAASV